jgi:hypothetical protein
MIAPREEIATTPQKTLFQRAREAMINPNIDPAQASNVMALSDATGERPSKVLHSYDELAGQVAQRTYPTAKTIGKTAMDVGIITALVSNPIDAATGLAIFFGIDELKNAAVSKYKKEPYKFQEGKGLADLLSAEGFSRDAIEIGEFVLEGMAAGGSTKMGRGLFGDVASRIRGKQGKVDFINEVAAEAKAQKTTPDEVVKTKLTGTPPGWEYEKRPGTVTKGADVAKDARTNKALDDLAQRYQGAPEPKGKPREYPKQTKSKGQRVTFEEVKEEAAPEQTREQKIIELAKSPLDELFSAETGKKELPGPKEPDAMDFIREAMQDDMVIPQILVDKYVREGGKIPEGKKYKESKPDTLRPAIEYENTVIPGEEGSTHPKIMKDNEIGPDEPHVRGFVTPDGEFLERPAAKDWLEKNDPETFKKWDELDKSTEALHSQDLNKATEETGQSKATSPEEKETPPVSSDVVRGKGLSIVKGKAEKELWQMTRNEYANKIINDSGEKIPIFASDKIGRIADAIEKMDLPYDDPDKMFANDFSKIFRENLPLSDAQWEKIGGKYFYDQVWEPYLDSIGAEGYWSSLNSQGTTAALKKVGGYKRLADELRKKPFLLTDQLRQKLSTRKALDNLTADMSRMFEIGETTEQALDKNKLKYLTEHPETMEGGTEHFGENVVSSLLKSAQEERYLPHKEAIQKALAEGKPVPEEVLKDYPELTKEPTHAIKEGDQQKGSVGQHKGTDELGKTAEAGGGDKPEAAKGGGEEEVTIPDQAKALNLEAKKWPDRDMYTIMDPENKGNFEVKAGEKVADKLAEHREKWAKGKEEKLLKKKAPPTLYQIARKEGLDFASLRQYVENPAGEGMLGITKKGGRKVDDWAGELQSRGIIGETPDEFSGPADYAVNLIKDEILKRSKKITEKLTEEEKGAISKLAEEVKDEGFTESEIESSRAELQSDFEKEIFDEALDRKLGEIHKAFDEDFIDEVEEEPPPITEGNQQGLFAEKDAPFSLSGNQPHKQSFFKPPEQKGGRMFDVKKADTDELLERREDGRNKSVLAEQPRRGSGDREKQGEGGKNSTKETDRGGEVSKAAGPETKESRVAGEQSRSDKEIGRWKDILSNEGKGGSQRLASYLASLGMGRKFGQSPESYYQFKGLTKFIEWGRKEVRAMEETTKKPILSDESGMVAVDLLAPGLEAGRNIVKGVQSLLLPTAKSAEHRAAAEVLGSKLGAMHRGAEVAGKALQKDARLFDKMGVHNPDVALEGNPGIKFMSDMSMGRKQPTPELQAIADKVDRLFKDRLQKLEDAGAPLKTVRENYFPGMWEDETKAVAFMAKRPFKGGESFRKQKVFEDIMEGIDAGMKPISLNPLDLVRLKLAEMDRSIMANQALQEWKQKGDVRFLRSGVELPEGYTNINDKYGTVYGPPEMLTSEYVDQAKWNALEETAKNLKTPATRQASLGGRKLGEYSRLEGIKTRANTPTSVYAHEIGHATDARYNLWDKIVNQAEGTGKKGDVTKTATAKMKATVNQELRDLADLTWEGQEPTEGYKKYTRKREEKIAHIFEAYVHVPERLMQVAPNVTAAFEKFLKTIPELKPLADIQGGISYMELQTKRNIGGFPVVGHWIAKQPVADVLNNYLSSSLYNNPYVGGLYRGYMGSANLLNQSQLGVFSAFHAGFTEAEVTISAGANIIKDSYGVLRGNRTIADLGKTIGKWPVAAFKTTVEGAKLLKEWETPSMDVSVDIPVSQLQNTKQGHTAMIAKAAELAGGAFKMEKGLRTEQTEKMIQNWYSGKTGKVKAALRSPVSLLELSAKPIMEWLVPRQKAGVFGELAGRIIEMNPDKTMNDLRPEFRQAWNRVDARLGQVRYDRLFINNTAKNVIQGLIRAPGWTGGTIAELGGAFKDAGSFIAEWARTGKAPENIPDRVAYTVSLAMTTALINGLATYMLTGEKPQGQDYWAFRTGSTDEYGRPERFMFPTYMKDVMAYWKAPLKTIFAKTHPIIGLLHDAAPGIGVNKDYYGVKIRNEDDPLYQQVLDTDGYVVKQFIPFWMRGAGKEAERGGGVMKTLENSPGKIVGPLIGIMPAPAAYTRTKFEDYASEIAQTKHTGTRTKEQAEKGSLKRQLEMGLRRGDEDATDKLADAKDDGKITAKDVKDIKTREKEDKTTRALKSAQMTLDELAKGIKYADEEEKEILRPLFKKKLNNKKDLTPEQREKYLQLWEDM